MPSGRLRVLLACLLGLATVSLTLGPLESASARAGVAAPIGSDRFVAKRDYRGDFPDPSVLRVGKVWYAYSTTTASLHLPVLTSTDLVHWRAVGEGMKSPARWAQSRRIGKRRFATTWAPTVARFGKRFVHAYATPVRQPGPRKMCISVSTSKRPGRGFVDRTARPLICPPNRGAIDPQFFTAPDGGRYLIWKSEQTASLPSQLFSTRISATGTKLYSTRLLLTTQDPWEGRLIENPSMIAYAGRYYLFYSGASYANDTYATGYAICDSPMGPCTRASTEPILATGGRVSGPGGGMAFIDTAGRLRLAYAAWDFGNTGYPKSSSCLRSAAGCPQRKLHVATLGADRAPEAAGTGLLVVTDRG